MLRQLLPAAAAPVPRTAVTVTVTQEEARRCLALAPHHMAACGAATLELGDLGGPRSPMAEDAQQVPYGAAALAAQLGRSLEQVGSSGALHSLEQGLQSAHALAPFRRSAAGAGRPTGAPARGAAGAGRRLLAQAGVPRPRRTSGGRGGGSHSQRAVSKMTARIISRSRPPRLPCVLLLAR